MAQSERFGLLFEFFKFRGKPLVRGERFAQLDEYTHDIQADFHRARRVEDGSCHQRPVLGEGERHRRGKLEPLEVVAICDHLVALGACEREHEIAGKASEVTFDLLVQTLGWHAVERGKIGAKRAKLVRLVRRSQCVGRGRYATGLRMKIFKTTYSGRVLLPNPN